MDKFSVIDAHCDTISKLAEQNTSLERNADIHVLFRDLRKAV